jgi:hypothetical protein
MTFFSFEIDWFDESCVAPTCRTRYPAHPSPVRPRAHRRFGAARPSSVRPHAQRRFGDGSFFCRRNAACAGGGPSCSAATRGAGTVRSAECLATRRLGTPWRTAHALLRPRHGSTIRLLGVDSVESDTFIFHLRDVCASTREDDVGRRRRRWRDMMGPTSGRRIEKKSKLCFGDHVVMLNDF